MRMLRDIKVDYQTHTHLDANVVAMGKKQHISTKHFKIILNEMFSGVFIRGYSGMYTWEEEETHQHMHSTTVQWKLPRGRTRVRCLGINRMDTGEMGWSLE